MSFHSDGLTAEKKYQGYSGEKEGSLQNKQTKSTANQLDRW